MDSDRSDLHAFVTAGDQRAFAALVRRHADLVYAACLRQLRDPTAAEDVAQQVFLLLWRKASHLPPGASVAGWLFLAARNLSNNAARTQERRRRHERSAAESRQEPTMPSDPAEWEAISHAVDAGLAALDEPDRSALLLRFFQNKRHEEIGALLGTTPQAAKMRVRRALDRLRSALARQGVTAMPTALLAGLKASALHPPAPAGFADATLAAVGAATLATSAGSVALKAAAATCTTASKIAASIAASVLLLSAVGTGVWALSGAPKPQSPPAPIRLALADAAPPADDNADWRGEFDALYRLDEGELVKRLPPPYIPARDRYYQSANTGVSRSGRRSTPVEVPDSILFNWDPAKQSAAWFTSTFGGRTFEEFLPSFTDLTPDRYLIPRELFGQPVTGDWIRRRDTDPGQLLQAIARVFANSPAAYTVTRTPLDRDVVVVRGGPYKSDISKVVTFTPATTQRANSRDQHGSQLLGFLQALSYSTGRPFINESTTPSNMAVVMWRRSAEIDKLHTLPKPEADARLRTLLPHLEKQMPGLTFSLETRKIDTWVLKPAAR